MNIARRIILAFGGTRPAARALGVPKSTVQSWIAAGNVPSWRQSRILDVARQRGLPLTADDFISAPCPQNSDKSNPPRGKMELDHKATSAEPQPAAPHSEINHEDAA